MCLCQIQDQKKQKIVCDKNYNPSNIEMLNAYFTLITRILENEFSRIKHKQNLNLKNLISLYICNSFF